MKIINLQYGPYSKPPATKEILSCNVLELHEGAFWLTGWPSKMYTCSSDVIREKNIARAFLYLPGPHPANQPPEGWFFNPNDMGDKFIEIYSAMQNAIRSGELEARGETLFIGDIYKENISYFVAPLALIKWAFQNDFFPPDEVQNATVRLQKHTKLRNRPGARQNRIKAIIVYQFLKQYYPGKPDTYYYGHDWMREFGSAKNSIDQDLGAIRKATSTLRVNRGRGARTKCSREKESYKPKIIGEIMCKDTQGRRCYDIDSLKIAIETAASIMLHIYLKSGFLKNQKHEMNQNQFLDHFLHHEIISLYTKEAPLIVSELIREYAESVVCSFFEYQATITIKL